MSQLPALFGNDIQMLYSEAGQTLHCKSLAISRPYLALPGIQACKLLLDQNLNTNCLVDQVELFKFDSQLRCYMAVSSTSSAEYKYVGAAPSNAYILD